MRKEKTGSRSLGAFKGVFVPTFLTIIGVILFLRTGQIVGSAGILGAVGIILLAVSVTFSTALSLSSIITNIRIGAGGAYSIISKTLGLEVGGSVGIPLYLAQMFSVSLYLFGFSEAWRFIFPDHNRFIILFGAFAVLFLITTISTALAIKAQLFVFVILIVALVSVFAGGNWMDGIIRTPAVGSFADGGFWVLFALFFPAVTGLMAGVGMSGELTDAKKQIPIGVLSALGITTLIYIAIVFWFGYSASADQLINNNLLIVELSAYAPLVLVGILMSTFSSALTTMIAAPRILQALGNNSVLPMSHFFSQSTKKGEPRNASVFTAGLVGASLFTGGLDFVAPILTMFFLITYSMINLVVYIEQSLGLVSFRPTLKIPRFVPLYGAISSIVFMFYINLIAGILSLAFLFTMYLFLVKRRLQPKHGDVRSGLFIALSEWAAKKVMSLPESTKHIWKPSILLPVSSTNTLLGNFPLIKSIVFPNGTLSVLGMKAGEIENALNEEVVQEEMETEMKILPSLVKKFGKEGIFTNYTEVDVDDYIEGVCISMQAIEGQFFHPNTLFIPAKPEKMRKGDIKRIFHTVEMEDSGLIIFDRDKAIGLGSQEDIHVWIDSDVMEQEDFYDSNRNFDLAMLTAYRLQRNWVGKINLHMCATEETAEKAKAYLRRLVYEARFPLSSGINVYTTTFYHALKNAPHGDIHIIPINDENHLIHIAETTKKVKVSYLLIKDSTHEDVLA